MKIAKAICATIILALSLSIPAYADSTPGEVHTPGKSSQVQCDSGTTDKQSEGPCAVTTGTDNGSFSDFVDFMWAVALFF